jgi:hypothetical protein
MHLLTLPALEDVVSATLDVAGTRGFAAANGCQLYVDSVQPAIAEHGGLTPQTAIRCLGPCEHAVSDVLTMALLELVEHGVVTEDQVEEPVEMSLDLAIVPVPGGLTPIDEAAAGAISPLEIAEIFATRTQVQLGGLSIQHNYGHDRWWFAVGVTELLGSEMRAVGVDGHITLFYLRSHQHAGEQVAAAMSRMLLQIQQRRGQLPVDFLFSGGLSPYSSESLAMIEILVACPAHMTPHRLANEGLSQAQRRQHAFVHPALRLSLRPTATATLEAGQFTAGRPGQRQLVFGSASAA